MMYRFILATLFSTSFFSASIGHCEKVIGTIHLKMDKLDAKVLFRKDPYDKSSFPVKVIEGNDTLPGRVSVKGSFTRQFLKKSIMIELKDGKKWRGGKKISLTAMATDPSSMRDWLAWDLVKSLGMTKPVVEYIRVFINDEFIGLFLYFEWITPNTLAEFGHGKDGEFFHPIDSAFCGHLSIETITRLEDCFFKLSPRNSDFTPLKQLIRGIDETQVKDFYKFVTQNFDVDSLVNWILVNAIVANGDTYNKNYFIYRRKKDKKWVLIPWDYDLSFGRNADPVLPFPKHIVNDNFQYHYSIELGNPSPLKEKFLKNKALYQKFQTRLSHVLGLEKEPGIGGFSWFNPTSFTNRIFQLKDQVDLYLKKDKYSRWSEEQRKNHVDALKHFNFMRFHMLKKQVLGVGPYGTPYWLPYTAYPVITPSQPDDLKRKKNIAINYSANIHAMKTAKKYVFVDEQYTRPLGIITLKQMNSPLNILVEVEAEQTPAPLPPNISPEKCIQKTWFIAIKDLETQVLLDLTLDYLQESTTRNEIGSKIRNETHLNIWTREEKKWKKLKTSINTYANTLRVEDLIFSDSRLRRFVACLD